MSENSDEHEIRRQIEQRHQKRFELIIHAIIFVVVNAGFWVVFGGAFWLLLMTLGWCIALAGHLLYYTSQYGAWWQSRRNAVEREVQRELARRTADEKPKNDMHMRLTDDGEIEEVPEDEDHWAEKPKRQL